MEFDRRGHLKPYSLIESSLEELGEVFTEELKNQQHRKELFRRYLAYLEELKSTVKVEFEQWVNGSFTTKKPSQAI
jgi:uncharacterized protein DUF6932